MVAFKSSCVKASNVNATDVVHLCQEDLVNVPVGKGDLHLLLVGHPGKLYVADLFAATRRSFGPSLKTNIVLKVQNRNKRLKNLYYKFWINIK